MNKCKNCKHYFYIDVMRKTLCKRITNGLENKEIAYSMCYNEGITGEFVVSKDFGCVLWEKKKNKGDSYEY